MPASSGRRDRETRRSPHPSPKDRFHVGRPCGCAAPRRDEKRFFLGGRSPPRPSHRVGVWGNRVSPHPCSRAAPSPFRGQGRGETGFPHTPAPAADVHGSRACGCAAPRRDEHKIVPGRATPSQTLPPGGGLGKPGFPGPLLAGCALPNPPADGSRPCGCTAHRPMQTARERGRPARVASPRANCPRSQEKGEHPRLTFALTSDRRGAML